MEIDRKNWFEKIIEIILFMFILSLPISKAGINLFGGIFGLLTLIDFFRKNNKTEIIKFYKENKLVLRFVFLFFIGIVVSILSSGGSKSTEMYITKHFYFIMIPGLLVYINGKNEKKIFSIFYIGLLIGIIKSFKVFYNEFGKNFEPWVRVHSFYDVGRWGAILLFSIVMLLPIISNEYFGKRKIVKMGLYILLILSVISIILTNARGPWLTLLISVVIYFFIFDFKKIKYFLALTFVFSIILYNSNQKSLSSIQERVNSVRNIRDISNMGRLLMWKEGLLFAVNNIKNRTILVGTGIGNMEKPLKKYLESKGNLEILMTRSSNQFSLSDNHNSFLNILNQLGIIYFIGYMYLMFNLFLYFIKKSFEKDEVITKSILLLLLSFFVCGMFYSYSISYEMFTLFFFVILGYKNTKKI